ncbi:MAG: type II methionyl aminopeptidase [archaeon]
MDELACYLKAGEVASRIIKKYKEKIKPGVFALEIAESIEKEIWETCKPAFPVNISINNQAAHFTPEFGSSYSFSEKDIIKIDIGTQVDGFICDCAFTVDLSGEYQNLVEACEVALENAIALIKPGIKIKEVGAEILRTINEKGFKPIRNLHGHLLTRYNLHSGISIPNVAEGEETLEEGQVFAIEPFATTGSGLVRETNFVEIFKIVKKSQVRQKSGRELLAKIEKYDNLPFAKRWLRKEFGEFELNLGLRELLLNKIIKSYPGLQDVPGSFVAQAEKTVLIEKDGARPLVEF